MNPIWKASYQRGIRLAKAGCALPHLDRLPGRSHSYQRSLYVNELGGYFESYAIDEGASTGYALALRIGTERGCGAIVTDFRFVSPWPEHLISWDCDPEGVLPQYRQHLYKHLAVSRLSAVLNERKFLRRGGPIEGLLCGRASAPIPSSAPREAPALAEISLVDDSGEWVRARIHLTIYCARTEDRSNTETAECATLRCPGTTGRKTI